MDVVLSGSAGGVSVSELVDSLTAYFRAEDLVGVEMLKGGGSRKVVGDIPSVPEWCYENGLTRDEFTALCSESAEFKRAVELGMCRLEGILVKHGLLGQLEGGMTKATLSNWFGWRDKSESSVKGEMVVKIMAEGAGL